MLRLNFLLLCLIISFSFFGQRPKKVYSLIKDKNTSEALIELNKYSSDKEYDSDDKILLELAKSLLMIDKTSGIYNPIKSIQNFNNISIPYNYNYKDDIDNFLSRYSFNLNLIQNNIYTEILIEAKRINSIESYSNALKVCSTNHKDELRVLLERKTLDDAKETKSILKLNNFIENYSNDLFKIEAIDFRDSLILKNTTENYDNLKSFILNYPNSKFNVVIEKKLPDLLYEEIEKTDYSKSLCKKFLYDFSNDVRTNKLDSILYFKAVKKDSINGFRNYIEVFKNGIFSQQAIDNINLKTLSKEKINKCLDIDSLISFAKCENILDFELEFTNRYIYLKFFLNAFKDNFINPLKIRLAVELTSFKRDFLTNIEIDKILHHQFFLNDYYKEENGNELFISYSNKSELICDEKCKLEKEHNNDNIDDELKKICLQNKNLKNICHAISAIPEYKKIGDYFEFEKIDNLLLIHVIPKELIGGFHESQNIGLINKQNQIKLFEDYCKSDIINKLENLILKKYRKKINIHCINYWVEKKSNCYTISFMYYTTLPKDVIYSCIQHYTKGSVELPFKIVNDSISLQFDKVKLIPYKKN